MQKDLLICYNFIRRLCMIVVSSADFFSNPASYREKAENYGLKILPLRKEKKLSRKIQRKLDVLNSAIGILPSDIKVASEKTEKSLKQ